MSGGGRDAGHPAVSEIRGLADVLLTGDGSRPPA